VTNCHALKHNQYWHTICAILIKQLKNRRIMDTMIFTKANLNFHQTITLIDRDDGKKNKTLEKEAGLPSV
jgi:hypothetical protein